jgi:hypothetical protein
MQGIIRSGTIITNTTIENHDFPDGQISLCCIQETINGVLEDKNCIKMNDGLQPLYMVVYDYENGTLIDFYKGYLNDHGKYCYISSNITEYLCES